MDLKDKVLNTLNWKKSETYCANKLNISVEKYRQIKNEVLNRKDKVKSSKFEYEENLDQGTANYKVVHTEKASTPEEVEKLIGITGSKKWKLSYFYNKQQADGTWLITAMVTAKTIENSAKELLANSINNFKPSVPKIIKTFDPDKVKKNGTAAVLSVQDLHFGKDGTFEVGESFVRAVIDLSNKAEKTFTPEKVYFVLGGDLLNMDTFNGETTKGTSVESMMSAQKAFDAALNYLYSAIYILAKFFPSVVIVYVPGNHDRLSSYHLAKALQQGFKNEKNIHFDVEYSERKVHTYGNNMFCFEHGDVNKRNTPLVYATEFPVEWGGSIYRTCYTGHFHSRKTTEYVSENELHGFSIKQLPSLAKTDYYHYHNKFTGSKRQAVIQFHDFFKGNIGELVYTAD